MPTYVYECSSCTQTFEVEQRITENALTSCPCGSEGTVKRLIQPTAMMFKGSGFYINDSAKAPDPAPACSPNGPCSVPGCAKNEAV
jgi:putative FmdB family regulatory protein